MPLNISMHNLQAEIESVAKVNERQKKHPTTRKKEKKTTRERKTNKKLWSHQSSCIIYGLECNEPNARYCGYGDGRIEWASVECEIRHLLCKNAQWTSRDHIASCVNAKLYYCRINPLTVSMWNRSTCIRNYTHIVCLCCRSHHRCRCRQRGSRLLYDEPAQIAPRRKTVADVKHCNRYACVCVCSALPFFFATPFHGLIVYIVIRINFNSPWFAYLYSGRLSSSDVCIFQRAHWMGSLFEVTNAIAMNRI